MSDNTAMIIYSAVFPALLVIFGLLFSCGLPRRRNRWFGLRTTRTFRSEAAWRYAHKTSGKLFLLFGLIILAVLGGIIVYTKGQISFLIANIFAGVSLVVLIAVALGIDLKLKKHPEI